VQQAPAWLPHALAPRTRAGACAVVRSAGGACSRARADLQVVLPTGASGRVIFSDISQDLLDHAQSLAQAVGVLDRVELSMPRQTTSEGSRTSQSTSSRHGQR
jgi:hypothetical protein